jgi:hypothetical protein
VENICTLYEFNQLPKYQQYDLLENYGAYLDIYRINGCVKIALFQLFDFYVEVYLDQVKDKIVKANPFAGNAAKLDLYLKDIDIHQAFELI